MSTSKLSPLAQAVFSAAKLGDVDAINSIFHASSCIEKIAALANDVDSEGKTPLIYAAALGQQGYEVAEALLNHGASQNCEQRSAKTIRAFGLGLFSGRGKSAMCFAAEANSTRIIEALLRHGARLDKGSVDELGRQPLSIAAASGFIHACSLLLAKGSPDLAWARDHEGLSAVAHACSSGSVDIVDMLLKASPGTPAEWSKPSAEGLSLMEHAAKYSNAECIESLASIVRDRPELQERRLRKLPQGGLSGSPLFVAANRGSFEVFHAILTHSLGWLSLEEIAMSISVPSASSEMRRSGAIVAKIISSWKRWASDSAKSPKNSSFSEFSLLASAIRSPCFIAAKFDRQLRQSCVFLFKNGQEALFRRSLSGSEAPRRLAPPQNKPESESRSKDSNGLRSIWDEVNLFSMVNQRGQSLIGIAIESNRPEALKAVLSMAHCLALTDLRSGSSFEAGLVDGEGGAAKAAGAISPLSSYPWIRTHGAGGLTPLALAAARGCMESCEALLDEGASVSDVDTHGWTPYMRAVQHGHVEIMSLFERRASESGLQDARTFFGETPAMIACSCSQSEALAHLCARPEDFARRALEARWDGTTALMLATSQSSLACMDIVLKASDVNAQNEKGATALAIACHDMSRDAVRILAPLTDPTLTDIDGMTPLIYAMWRSPSFKSGAACVDILSDFQNPGDRFYPSKRINARFGDRSCSSFNALEWAEFLFSHVAGHQEINASEAIRKKMELWEHGGLPPRKSAHPESSGEPVLEMSALPQALAMEKLAILARKKIAAIEGAAPERSPRSLRGS